MEPFQRGHLPPEAFTVEHYLRKGYTQAQAELAIRHNNEETIWMNNVYQVNVVELPAHDGIPDMVWLSIKRRDKRVLRDWRQLQEIKNALVGPENEAVEIFPAESRLVDTANQCHLYAIKDASLRFPFGFNDGRHVATAEMAARSGAKQRNRKDG